VRGRALATVATMHRRLVGSPCSGTEADGAAEPSGNAGRTRSTAKARSDGRQLTCRSLIAYRDEDPRLTLIYVSGPAYAFEYAVLEEREDVVIIGVVESAKPGAKSRVGVQRTAEVELARALGNREVTDARTGRRLPAAPPNL
jgi:hypothetical protein